MFCSRPSSFKFVTCAMLLFGILFLRLEFAHAQDDADLEAIAGQIDKLITALRTGDAELYASVYVEDADYINTDSPHMVGIDAVRSEAEEVVTNLGAMPDFDLPILNIRFLEDDIAVVNCLVTLSDARATYYMVKRQGSWQIASARILQPERE